MKLMVYFCLILIIKIIQSFRLKQLNTTLNENIFKKSYLNIDEIHSSKNKIEQNNNFSAKSLLNKNENASILNNLNNFNITKPDSLETISLPLLQYNQSNQNKIEINENRQNNYFSLTKNKELKILKNKTEQILKNINKNFSSIEMIPFNIQNNYTNINETLIPKDKLIDSNIIQTSQYTQNKIHIVNKEKDLDNLSSQLIKKNITNSTSQLKKDIRNIEHHIKNATRKTHLFVTQKIESLRNSIKDSFNQLLLSNQKSQQNAENQKIDMLQNIDTMVKSLVKNVTNNQNNEIKKEIKSIMPLRKEPINSINQQILDKESNQINKKNHEKKRTNSLSNFVLQKKRRKKHLKNKFNLTNKNVSSNYSDYEEEDDDEEEKKENNDNVTKQFLANVINQLISHPLHIREGDESDNTKNRLGNLRPNIMIISNSDTPRINNKNTFNSRSHNVFYNRRHN